MPEHTPTYDLILLLSATTSDEDRAAIVTEVESQISAAGGSAERKGEWGTRPLAFQIRHESEAEYHLLQFSGPPTLLETLEHSLRIDDRVLRFRIIKVIPGMPEPPESAPPVIAGAVQSGPPGRDAEPDSER